MKDRVYRFGSIGGSGYALVLLDCLERFIEKGQVQLTAAAVLPKEQGSEAMTRARSRGTQIFDDWRQMLEATRGKLDVCIIPTGIAQHRPMATYAMELGHRVFLEKPLAGSFEDALAIVEAAQQHGDALSIGYQDIYQASAHRIHDLVREGALGRIRSIRGYGLWPRNSNYYGRNTWAGKVRVGDDWVLDSPLNNALAHYLNLMLFWASPSDNTAARFDRIEAELYRARAIDNFDTGSVRIHTEAGFPVEFHVTHSCRENAGPVIRIEGDKGRIDWYAFERWELHSGGRIETSPLEHSLPMRENMFRSLMDWVDGNPSLRCTALQGLGQSQCIGMLHLLGAVPEIPAQFLDAESVAEGAPVITGIDEVLRRCFEQGGLPGEHGAPWSTGVRTVETPAQWAQALERVSEAAVKV